MMENEKEVPVSWKIKNNSSLTPQKSRSSGFQYNPKTISKWVSLYQTGGIDALMPKERSDKGSTRVLPDTAIEEIYRLKEAFPRLNATQIHKQLVENSFIPATVNVCAVQRFIRNHDPPGIPT